MLLLLLFYTLTATTTTAYWQLPPCVSFSPSLSLTLFFFKNRRKTNVSFFLFCKIIIKRERGSYVLRRWLTSLQPQTNVFTIVYMYMYIYIYVVSSLENTWQTYGKKICLYICRNMYVCVLNFIFVFFFLNTAMCSWFFH